MPIEDQDVLIVIFTVAVALYWLAGGAAMLYEQIQEAFKKDRDK